MKLKLNPDRVASSPTLAQKQAGGFNFGQIQNPTGNPLLKTPSASNITESSQFGITGLANLTRDRDLYNKNIGLAEQYSQLAQNPELLKLVSGQATAPQEEAYKSAFDALNVGKETAEGRIRDTVRSEATSRGLFSSQGAIASEAANIADLEKNIANQRAGLFGQKAQTSLENQRLGFGTIQNLYQGIGQGYGAAGEQNKYLANLYQTIPSISQSLQQTKYSEPQRQKFLGIF